jgi:hypothetical protein
MGHGVEQGFLGSLAFPPSLFCRSKGEAGGRNLLVCILLGGHPGQAAGGFWLQPLLWCGGSRIPMRAACLQAYSASNQPARSN